MDSSQLGTAADLEVLAARVADPGIELKTRNAYASELRESIENVKDADAARIIPSLVPVLFQVLHAGEPALKKDTLDFQFRRILVEIINRVSYTEAFRPQFPSLLNDFLRILRFDNEENAVSCCKTVLEICRSFRPSVFAEENVMELVSIFTESLRNARGSVQEWLSESSPLADPNYVLPGIRSFKLLMEMSSTVVLLLGLRRDLVLPSINGTLPLALDVLKLQSPAQQKAREDQEAMGSLWAGVAPTIKNVQLQTDFLTAQCKMVSFVVLTLRGSQEQLDLWGDSLMLTAFRLLQDCPPHAVALRKEILIVFRHFINNTNYRRALLPHVDKLLMEDFLLGSALGSRETLRISAYTQVADLLHHLRAELAPLQLTRVLQLYSELIHYPYCSAGSHSLFLKVMLGAIDVLVAKDTQAAVRAATAVMESVVDRLDSLAATQGDILARLEAHRKGETEAVDVSFIEKTRVIQGAFYAVDKPEVVWAESRNCVKAALHCLRACLAALRRCEAPAPDGTLIFRIFESCIKCSGLYDSDSLAVNEVMETFANLLFEVNSHTFQEVWSLKIGFFFEHLRKRPMILHVCNVLLNRESTSSTLLAVILKFLVEHLPLLGDYEDAVAVVIIRWYKMAFGAVSIHPAKNEAILASHLGRLIMDCFPLAAKAAKPTHYFHLLRALFRAIGVGGGKFELLYKEVLPLLPEMLECLNRQLHISDKFGRDLIVELCLTVPLRLTHLLPHLTYLMQPLALALRGGPELVAQGLRTLELCIDNLTADFLDPTLETVLRDLMEALHAHLKPHPANHVHSHTTIRILGKLGGRNRRLLTKDPVMEYTAYTDRAKASISFGGQLEEFELGPGSILAAKELQKPLSSYRPQAFQYVKTCLAVLAHQGFEGRDSQSILQRSLEGMFDAIHVPEIQEEAEMFVRDISRYIFGLEVRRLSNREFVQRRWPTATLSCYLEALPHAVTRENEEESKKALQLIENVVQDLVGMANTTDVTSQDVVPILHHIANRFSAMCLEDFWVRKRAGCNGIKIMTQTHDLGVKWVIEHAVNLIRTLLHVLKDLPSDLPRDVDEVIDLMKLILRMSKAGMATAVEEMRPQKLAQLISVFGAELSSRNPVARDAVQTCIEIVAELSGRTQYELLEPQRDRILQNLYTKPLRTLPFSLQIGVIEAMRYCVSLEPPLPELGEELLRLLHETLALADAEDITLLGRGNVRQSGIEIVKLRVACIKLLSASMPITDFFSKQSATRQKVTSVFFKSLYSAHKEIKDVAHEGLGMALKIQNRLPKELLQQGLRPILMNLADPKRLSVPGLEGLARLLELLTNYFKVEVGFKLLDHFRQLADPQTLQEASRDLLSENEAIMKLVRLANIFHLLPANADCFLEDYINAIVHTEAAMEFSSRSPFSDPLAKYVDRFPAKSVDFFIRHLRYPRHLRTLRSVLQAELAPNLQREVISRTHMIVMNCLLGSDPALMLPGLLLFSDVVELVPTWLDDNPMVVNALIQVWRAERRLEQASPSEYEVRQRTSLLLNIFRRALEQSPRIDLLFEIVAVYSRGLALDLTQLTRFIYKHVALEGSLLYRRNLLLRFLLWFEQSTSSWSDKTYFIRFVVTPMLLVHSARPSKAGLLDDDIVQRLLRTVWRPLNDKIAFVDAGDMFKIEVLQMTTVIVRHYHDAVQHLKKEIIVGVWQDILSEEVLVQQAAYLLAARFFEAFETPPKFILRAWTGLLRPPHPEGFSRTLTRQALDILALTVSKNAGNEAGYPQWARTTRRVLAEEGSAPLQLNVVFYLIVHHPDIFYPVRALFVPPIINSLNKLGQPHAQSPDARLLSVDILQVIFNWEQKTSAMTDENAMDVDTAESNKPADVWTTPIAFRETIVSFLVRLASLPAMDVSSRTIVVPRALALIRQIFGTPGWKDVTVKLNYYSRALEQSELTTELAILQAAGAARVLQVVCADKSDDWFIEQGPILQRLVRKGLLTDDHSLQDALHPIFDRLIKLFPLPKEEEESQGEMAEFHAFVYSSITDGLGNATAIRATIMMLTSVVQVDAERILPFSTALMRLIGKLVRDHIGPPPVTADATVRLLTSSLEAARIAVGFLGEQRRWLLASIVTLVEKSKSLQLCTYLLDLARDWALHKRDPYPTLKEKASLLQKMTLFENRWDSLFSKFLELIHDIYVDPSLRRSDLTTRLEQAFLHGCRARDAAMRDRFMELLDANIPRSLFGRLTYVLGSQSWEPLADHNWIHIALYLLLGAADLSAPLVKDALASVDMSTAPWNVDRQAESLMRPLQRLVSLDPQLAQDVWVSVFPAAWTCLSRREQVDITHHMIALLSKDYHIKQSETRPNVIQALLAGLQACSPSMILPPHLVKYLAKTFGAWHVSVELLTGSLEHVPGDEPNARDVVLDSLAEIYAELAEDDLLYGLWRRRALHPETNAGVGFEQNGMWEQAATTYEGALVKSKNGTIPFTEAEYCLWEDHWVLAQEKLQQWDILLELGRHELNQELVLESAWRTVDWSEDAKIPTEALALMSDVATPRRRVFEAFLALVKSPGALERNVDFQRYLEDAMQLTLRKWVSLPSDMSYAHVPLLQHFQQFVELQEAVQIFGSLHTTNAQNLEKKSSDLKMVLQAWRERLPNLWDDISVWSDLVAWRRNVFNAINSAYLPLIQNTAQNGNASSSNSFGYRGHHETAWIINRFAHVARKHHLLDVCQVYLQTIYTLPNIEISEAFLKLREQARCHYEKASELQSGLEVINNTNLMYFTNQQKAEFYTLKAMFYAKLGRPEEASHAFGQAVQMDMHQAKAWAQWAKFHDRMFKENPTDVSLAGSAITAYLQAAGLYKNGKSRPLLARVLWLLSVDDSTFTIARHFDQYKGEAAFWYWITYIPQLCLSLSQREVKHARYILLNLAKLFPQALFYHLRTTRDDMMHMRRQAAQRMAMENAANPAGAQPPPAAPASQDGPTQASPQQGHASPANPEAQRPVYQEPNHLRQAWAYLDEVVQILKTAFPLLILSLETMVEQLSTRFKANPEEEIYRFICMLLQDAIQTYVVRMNNLEDDGQMNKQTITNLSRMAPSLSGQARKDYEEDFIHSKPNHYEYVRKLQTWRDRYEKFLESRPRTQSLDMISHWLTEIQYGKFDEIEVPGQYTEMRDTNQNFVRIQKFHCKFENGRSQGYCWRRLTIIGHDNSKTSFAVQTPSGRHIRREDRVMQVFRMFNVTLARKKETRKRNLLFHIPPAILCTPTLRLLQNDSSYIALSDIYEQHCDAMGITREEPVLLVGEKVKVLLQEFVRTHGRAAAQEEYFNLKKDLWDELVAKLIPEDVLTKYMVRTMKGPSELWAMRKQFSTQLAACNFMTYLFSLTGRQPSRFQLSRETGRIAMSELMPGMNNQAPIFASNDIVPFRFTPNMQQFVGPFHMEGIMTAGMMSIGRSLTEPEYELEQQLCLFSRDEVTNWLATRGKPYAMDLNFRQQVAMNIDHIVRRAETMACKLEREQVVTPNTPAEPVVRTVVNLLSQAMNPINLVKMTEIYQPWF